MHAPAAIPVLLILTALVGGCTTTTPYVTKSVEMSGSLLPHDRFEEIASVPDWRSAMLMQRAGMNVLMEHQADPRLCVNEAAKSLLNWCSNRWTQSITSALPRINNDLKEWRKAHPSTGDGYVQSALIQEYLNSTNTAVAEARSNFTFSAFQGSNVWDLVTEIGTHHRPVMTPFMLSPIPRHGRIAARLGLFLAYPIDRLVLWTSQCLGSDFSLIRELALHGEDDVYKYYLHAVVVTGIFQKRETDELFVVILDPWGGYTPAFSGRSRIVEVIRAEDFDIRWRRWKDLVPSKTIRAKWSRMASPGVMLVLREK